MYGGGAIGLASLRRDGFERDMREKLGRLQLPRHCSAMPVLVHANEVSENVLYGDTFLRVINFADILQRAS